MRIVNIITLAILPVAAIANTNSVDNARYVLAKENSSELCSLELINGKLNSWRRGESTNNVSIPVQCGNFTDPRFRNLVFDKDGKLVEVSEMYFIRDLKLEQIIEERKKRQRLLEAQRKKPKADK